MKQFKKIKKISRVVAVSMCACAPQMATALSVGFEAETTASVSDNINVENRGEEVGGSTVSGQFSIFGDHISSWIQAGFTGELGGLKRFYDDAGESDDVSSLSRFYGSLEIRISPRALSWYVGDVLGGSGREDGVTSTDESLLENRRNVFITGPILSFQLDSTSALNGSLFYIDNSDDVGTELPSLYTLQADYSSQMQGGLRWGINLGNIMVDNPDASLEPDFNRASTDVFLERTRGLDVIMGSIGMTNYRADDYDLTGASLGLSWDRALTQQSSFFIRLNRDLIDETLTAVESLTSTGDAVIEDGSGIFNRTTLMAGYKQDTQETSWSFNVGVEDTTYEAVIQDSGEVVQNSGDQDQLSYFADVSMARILAARHSVSLNAGYRREDFQNNDDFSRSMTAGAGWTYQLIRDFELSLGYEHEINESVSTVFAAEGEDSVDNRVALTLRFRPLSRINRDLVVKLKSLVY